MVVDVCVIGAGIVGLSTAYHILRTIPDVKVVIISEDFSPDTTSNVAAGLYRPGLAFSGPTREITVEWLKDSLSFIKDVYHNLKEGDEAGIIEVSGYMYATEREQVVKNHFLQEILDVHRPCTEEELSQFSAGYKYGTFLTTYLIDCTKHLPYLTKKILDLGGEFVKKKIASFDDVPERFQVVCNCSGLGARELCADVRMTPMRGQVFKVRAPWVKEFVYVDYDTYIIPGPELVTLGGTRQFDSWNLKVDEHDAAGIWERCCNAVPSLKDAKVVKQLVGLRPYRPIVRVEKERVNLTNGRELNLVHNYGHGGYGVMSASGTAVHAAKIVNEIVQDLKYTSKL